MCLVDHLTEAQKRIFMINRAPDAGWDEDLLRVELKHTS